MESLRQLASDTADSLASPALPWCQAYQLAFLLDHASSEKRGDLLHGQQLLPQFICPGLHLERLLQSCPWRRHNTEGGSSPMISPWLVWGRVPGARGHPRWWEDTVHSTGWLLPAILIRAALGQLGTTPPQPACSIGCLGIRETDRQVVKKPAHQATT